MNESLPFHSHLFRSLFVMCRRLSSPKQTQRGKKSYLLHFFLSQKSEEYYDDDNVEWRWAKVIYLMKNYNDKDEERRKAKGRRRGRTAEKWMNTSAHISKEVKREGTGMNEMRILSAFSHLLKEKKECFKLSYLFALLKRVVIVHVWWVSHIRASRHHNLDCIINNIPREIEKLTLISSFLI